MNRCSNYLLQVLLLGISEMKLDIYIPRCFNPVLGQWVEMSGCGGPPVNGEASSVVVTLLLHSIFVALS